MSTTVTPIFSSEFLVRAPTLTKLISGNEKGLTLKFTGNDGQRDITLKFKPEATISAIQLSQVFTLALAANSGMHINALEYVKNHHLENHFTYE